MFRVAQALGRTIRELEESMDYAELKEWEAYFSYEPTMADRMETQLALFMQMISGLVYKEPQEMKNFMICPLKRAKKETEPKGKVQKLWKQLTAIFGEKNE